jgi:hypothetical protein
MTTSEENALKSEILPVKSRICFGGGWWIATVNLPLKNAEFGALTYHKSNPAYFWWSLTIHSSTRASASERVNGERLQVPRIPKWSSLPSA